MLNSLSITFIFPILSSISGNISWSRVLGISLISFFSQYLLKFPGSGKIKSGCKSKSSKFDEPVLTCFNKSVLPIISFNVLKPNSANISLTSSAINLNKFTTFSGVPLNFSLNF